MARAMNVILALTLLTVSIASDVPDLTSDSVPSISYGKALASALTVDNDDVRAATDVRNDSAAQFVIPVLRHAKSRSAKARGGKRGKPKARAHSSKGVTATATSSGTVVIATSKNGKRCVTIKKPCGTTCSSDSKSIGMCSGGWKPKVCYKTKKLLLPCPGKKVKMCTTTEKVRDVCEKKVKKKVKCPDTQSKRNVCAYPKVPVHSCKKLPPKCSKLGKNKCKYRNVTRKYLCTKPKRPCRECFNNTVFKKCKAAVTRKVEVPCGNPAATATSGSTTPRPTPSSTGANSRSLPQKSTTASGATPLATPSGSPVDEVGFFQDQEGYDSSLDDSSGGFKGFDTFENNVGGEQGEDTFGDFSAVPKTFGAAREHTKSVRCFASLFDDEECNGAPAFCQLFDNSFDSDRCTREVCRECNVVKTLQVGQELKSYCRDLRASCHFFSRMLVTRMMYAAAVARSSTQKNDETKKCYKNETKTVVVPCNYRLPKSEACKLGCRVKRCEKVEKKRVSKYCKGHLPKSCYKKCRRKMVKRKVCHTVVEWKRSSKTCQKDTKVKYKCYKKKTVKKPCKGESNKLCSKLQKAKYICGKVARKFGKCSGKKGEKRCKTKMCAQKKCS